jgi:hypothetical protein
VADGSGCQAGSRRSGCQAGSRSGQHHHCPASVSEPRARAHDARDPTETGVEGLHANPDASKAASPNAELVFDSRKPARPHGGRESFATARFLAPALGIISPGSGQAGERILDRQAIFIGLLAAFFDPLRQKRRSRASARRALRPPPEPAHTCEAPRLWSRCRVICRLGRGLARRQASSASASLIAAHRYTPCRCRGLCSSRSGACAPTSDWSIEPITRRVHGI